MAGNWYAPVASYRLTAGFGQSGRMWKSTHQGIDFAAPYGTPIRAVVPGVVIASGWAGAYGNSVTVRHADGSTSRYGHQSRIAVRVGTRVGRGALIGYVGSTGNSTGNHVHFEVRKNGRAVDPTPWLSANYSASAATSNQASRPGMYGGVRLDREQIRNAQTIISVGRRMGASERDLVIGIMTAFQESNLRNLNYGDRDSLGLFQQRAGWGSAAQRRNPTYAAGKFFENLLRIGNRGRMRLTEAAQAVQRSAFPNAYARWEELARAVVGSPGAGAYPVTGYDTYWENQITQWRDPSEVFASMSLFAPEQLSPEPDSPAAGMGAGPAESTEAGPTGTMAPVAPEVLAEEDLPPDFDWGAFAPGVPEPSAPSRSSRGRTPAPAGRGPLEF